LNEKQTRVGDSICSRPWCCYDHTEPLSKLSTLSESAVGSKLNPWTVWRAPKHFSLWMRNPLNVDSRYWCPQWIWLPTVLNDCPAQRLPPSKRYESACAVDCCFLAPKYVFHSSPYSSTRYAILSVTSDSMAFAQRQEERDGPVVVCDRVVSRIRLLQRYDLRNLPFARHFSRLEHIMLLEDEKRYCFD
jgi:hypothetical protein